MSHLSDVDLLDLVLGDAKPEAHLGECDRCGARLAALRVAIDEDRSRLAARVDAKPEAFWAAQRDAIASRIAQPKARLWTAAPRWAVAALLLAITAGAWFGWDGSEPSPPAPAATASSRPAIDLPTSDPWAAEELAGWEAAVQWESWLQTAEGAQEEGI